MQIKWFGQSCFKISTGINSIVFDPFCQMANYPALKLKANRLYISHQHRDHNNKECVELSPWEQDDKICSIEEIASFHDNEGGAKKGANTIHIFNYDGKNIRIAHLGDLGHMLSGEEFEAVKSCNVMLIPVGGYYTIDGAEAAELVRRAVPRVVIPMHYRFGIYGPEVISGVEPFLEAIRFDYPTVHMRGNVLNYDTDTPKGVYLPEYTGDIN